MSSLVPYGATAACGMRDELQIGGFQSNSRLVAYISDGRGGFTGGGLPSNSIAPMAHAAPVFEPLPLGYARFRSSAFVNRVKPCVEAVLSNRSFSWHGIGLGMLDEAEREVVRIRAMEARLIPRIPVNPQTFRADFSRVAIESSSCPGTSGSRQTTCSLTMSMI